MSAGKLALCLVDRDNEFQQMAWQDGQAAARKAGLAIEAHWSGAELAAQLSQVQELIDSPAPPSAILVMAVRDQGLARLARDAAGAGIHWVFLNRSGDDVAGLRAEHPKLAICQVYPDEVETGRVQGQVIQALLPQGGKVVQVQGSKRSLAARDRSAGTHEVLETGKCKLIELEAGWTEEEGYNALVGWLRVVVQANMRLDLIACHNDLLARGARRALADVAKDLGKPALPSTPIVGCDGTPSLGQAMVGSGELAATVVLPRSSGPAVEIIARTLGGGERPPEKVTLNATPFPELGALGAARG